MITIVLTYRNRNINIVSKCLNSLKEQTNSNFKVVLVNYGSNERYTKALALESKKHDFLSIVQCQTQQQLWCKSRAINLVLKKCDTPYFFVGDVDMIYHPNFIELISKYNLDKNSIYFQVGFLSKEESVLNKKFNNYKINFKSSKGATGMTLFNTETLKAINGFDEYYNGWGSEDTDAHVRLENAGYSVKFYDNQILMLHQWHEKEYRSKDSLAPFHSNLEQINNEYLKLTKKTKRTLANTKFPFGIYNNEDYNLLLQVDESYILTNSEAEIKAFINLVLLQEKNKVIKLKIEKHQDYKSLKNIIKKIIGKKTIQFLDMQSINNLLLENIIYSLRNQPYSHTYNQDKETLNLIVKL